MLPSKRPELDHRTSSGETDVSEREKLPEDFKYACCRESPRPCVNQDLVDEFKILRKNRFLEFGPGEFKGISYARACSSLIACPYKIETKEDAMRLPYISVKTSGHIEDFLKHGFMAEAENIRKSERFKTLSDFSQVHGVGYTTARQIYDSGITSMEQLKASGKYDFKYHDDIQLPCVCFHVPISRKDVESIHAFVKIQLDKVQPGAHTLICGGYRRGKSHSNDVDILITYPHEEGKERGVLKKLMVRLRAKGLVPPDGTLFESHPATNRTGAYNKKATMMDSLDKAFVVFLHPANNTDRPKTVARRVDLIVSRWGSWGSAVVGWTGSTQFERDLRRWAEIRCDLKFDSGGIRTRATDASVEAVTEEDVFRVMGLPWIPPHLRNADP